MLPKKTMGLQLEGALLALKVQPEASNPESFCKKKRRKKSVNPPQTKKNKVPSFSLPKAELYLASLPTPKETPTSITSETSKRPKINLQFSWLYGAF